MSSADQLDFQRYQALLQFHAEVAATLDAGDWARWPDYFVADGIYRLQPRENFERGFPLATLAFDSQAMMRDRVYGITETIFHDPYYQRHVIGAPLLRGLERDAAGRDIALYHVEGRVYATDNLCSHGNARLCDGFLLDHEIECPLHQGRFDIRDGRAQCAPLTEDIASWPVRIEAGRVWVAL